MVLSQVLLNLRVQECSCRITLVVMVNMGNAGHYRGIDLSWMIVEFKVRAPILVYNHLVENRLSISFLVCFTLKHLLCFTHKVLPMRAKIHTDNFMLSFFRPLRLTLIMNCNGWIVWWLGVLHGSILLITNSEVAAQHLLLNLFFVLNRGIIGEVLIFDRGRALRQPTLASLISQLKMALSQIHYWPLNLFTLKQDIISLVWWDTLEPYLCHFRYGCILIPTFGIRDFEITFSIVWGSDSWLSQQWLILISAKSRCRFTIALWVKRWFVRIVVKT